MGDGEGDENKRWARVVINVAIQLPERPGVMNLLGFCLGEVHRVWNGNECAVTGILPPTEQS